MMGHTGLEMIHVLCSLCHKNNAVISYTEVINGIKRSSFCAANALKNILQGEPGWDFRPRQDFWPGF